MGSGRKDTHDKVVNQNHQQLRNQYRTLFHKRIRCFYENPQVQADVQPVERGLDHERNLLLHHRGFTFLHISKRESLFSDTEPSGRPDAVYWGVANGGV